MEQVDWLNCPGRAPPSSCRLAQLVNRGAAGGSSDEFESELIRDLLAEVRACRPTTRHRDSCIRFYLPAFFLFFFFL